jgi:quercetin dioxygenase-like cupin family protein
MKKVDRRSAIALGIATTTALVAAPGMSQPQTRSATEGKEILPGVRQIDVSPPRPSKLPGFKTVSMRDVALQPGAEIPEFAMPNAMLCHVTQGELAVRQDGNAFTAKMGDAWDCGKGTRETAKNNGTAIAVMRIIDLDMSMT